MQANTPAIPSKPGTGGFTSSETPKKDDPPKDKGGRPRDPNAKTFEPIGLRPSDWEYVTLWAIDSYNVPDNLSTRLERMISRLRAMAPKGPDNFGHDRDPSQAPTPRTTPAVALTAKRRGITKAEQINEMYAFWREHHQEEGK